MAIGVKYVTKLLPRLGRNDRRARIGLRNRSPVAFVVLEGIAPLAAVLCTDDISTPDRSSSRTKPFAAAVDGPTAFGRGGPARLALATGSFRSAGSGGSVAP